jgi:Zn-dependent protease with chaperone function
VSAPEDRQILINRLEQFSRKNPAAYRFRVMLVAALGYAYLFAVVIVLLSIVGLTIWAMFAANQLNFLAIKFLWIPLVLAGLVLRSMWVSIPVPNGKEVNRDQAPKLFDLITEVRTALAGPDIHHVLLSDELNAGIVQVPQFGMFGWTSNYMVVGLPLLKAVGPKELRAVIAHEFGHLSGKHGRFAGWIYRVRKSWIQILHSVKTERHYASFLFDWFIEWYAPYFNAYSFVLARAQEHEADQYSIETAGKTIAARTLVQVKLKARALNDELWSDFYRKAADQPQAPKNAFALMLTAIEQPLVQMKVEQWLRQELRVETGYDDTHPALAERLQGMGFSEEVLTSDSLLQALELNNGSPPESAAQHYLKEIPAEITESYDRLWREQVVSTWKQTHNFFQKTRTRLAELDEESKLRPLTIEEQWERAKCTADSQDSAAALPIVREIIQQDPNHVAANFALGATLLEQQDDTGIALLEKAMQLDKATSGAAFELLYNFCQAQGRLVEAETYRAQALEYYDRAQRLHEQAVKLTPRDHLEPHGLDDAALKHLQDQLAKAYGLAAAYLVRKIVETEQFYVLAVLASYTWKGGQSGKHVGDLIDRLAASIDLDKPILIASLDVRTDLSQAFSKVPGAEVYLRDKEAGLEYRH